jgi:latent transforming growth factor beta binding protein
VVVYAFNPSTREAEARSSRFAWSTEWVAGQPGLHATQGNPLSKTNTLPFVSSGTFPGSQPQAPASPSLPARPPAPPPPRRPSPPRQGPVSSGRRECYFDTAAPDACDNILARNVTWQECCCTVGEGWGSGCRIQQCPGTETGGRGL